MLRLEEEDSGDENELCGAVGEASDAFERMNAIVEEATPHVEAIRCLVQDSKTEGKFLKWMCSVRLFPASVHTVFIQSPLHLRASLTQLVSSGISEVLSSLSRAVTFYSGATSELWSCF